MFRYAGQRFDPLTGLVYDNARFYSPALGRFLQPDPIGYAGGNNLYAYGGNDPVNATDPSGLNGQTALGNYSLLKGAAIGLTAACAVAEPCGAIELGGVGLAAGLAIILNTSGDQAQQPQAPSLPDSLIGQNARPGGSRNQHRSPRDKPDARGVVQQLGGGGQSVTLANGTRVAPNGIRLRPDTGSGPRIDIPANGSKPHETIHFPGSGP